MATVTVGVLTVFNHEIQDWVLFKGQLQQWFLANEITIESDKSGAKRRAILLSSLAEATYRLIRDLALPTDVGSLSYDDVIKLFSGHFEAKKCTFAERYKFHSAFQKPEESLVGWSARVRGLAMECGFDAAGLQDTLRDRFVLGMLGGPERDRLFNEPMEQLTLQKALQIAEGVRCAREGARQNVGAHTPISPASIVDVHKMSSRDRDRDRDRGRDQTSSSASSGVTARAASTAATGSSEQCAVCGYFGHNTKRCRFRNSSCRKCGVKGHIQRVCSSKMRAGNQHFLQCCSDDGDDGKRLLFNIRSFQGEPMQESVRVDDITLSFEVDTGSAVTAISDNVYKKHFSNYPLTLSGKVLQSYNGTSIDTLGTILLPFSFRSQTELIRVFVVRNGGPPLLGRDFIAKFKLQICSINQCKLSDKLDYFAQMYPRLFSDELGSCSVREVKLHLKPDTSPFYFKARPVPFALKSKLEVEIDRLLALGIIEPVPFSDYASPIVPVLRKDGQIRLCADYSVSLNKRLLVEEYPLPRVEELFSKLHNGVQFTKLDLSGAYNQLLLHKDSQDLTCISTHKGLYKFTRLVFGLASAPAIFQRTLENILTAPDKNGSPSPLQDGVLQFLDDILVTGRTSSEHMARLKEVFKRLENAGLVLKKEKCFFFQDSVSYLGFVIDKNGIHKSPDKIETIVNAKRPENITELKSFLGLVNYYRSFIKNASSILSPLHELLQKNIKWQWDSRHETAFRQIKENLVSDSTLAHFNPDARIILTVDASPFGLGCILSQIDVDGVERPVSYASRSLNSAEKQYSQIQKEATAIVFGVRKYHQYLYGRAEPFILRTDHKPLISIFHPDKGIPEVSANRLQRYALFLSAYNYLIEYVCSADNTADYLSRSMAPVTSAKEGSKQSTREPVLYSSADEACYVNFVLSPNETPISLLEVSRATESDHVLSQVVKLTLRGWPAKVSDAGLSAFYGCRFDLSVEKGCLMRGTKLVVPDSYRQAIIKELHAGHLGVVKMKADARARFWWPGMSADLERAADSCTVCMHLRPTPRRAPLTPWPYPAEPWHRVHLDFLGPFNGKMYLVIVDAYSKWVEVYDVSAGYGSKVVINKLTDLMARFGLINTICTDNGTSFVSNEFETFCANNGITHLTSPAYHPASNGQAESYVKIIKRALKAILLSGSRISELNVKLNEFLFNYRNSIHSSTNKSPAEVLFGRKLRCRLDLLKHQPSASSDTALAETVKNNQSLQTKYYKGSRNIDFSVNDSVIVKAHQNQKTFWTRGIIKKKMGKSAYLVYLLDFDRVVKRHKNQIYELKGESEATVLNDSEVRLASRDLPATERLIFPSFPTHARSQATSSEVIPAVAAEPSAPQPTRVQPDVQECAGAALHPPAKCSTPVADEWLDAETAQVAVEGAASIVAPTVEDGGDATAQTVASTDIGPQETQQPASTVASTDTGSSQRPSRSVRIRVPTKKFF